MIAQISELDNSKLIEARSMVFIVVPTTRPIVSMRRNLGSRGDPCRRYKIPGWTAEGSFRFVIHRLLQIHVLKVLAQDCSLGVSLVVVSA
ncbi:hypothetical protein KPH14_005549 [Odynerus spinipes]|uniref:Uncharacterized protein n=1 Tax=Odynerus spinipes TaxID=1348599 RepID=A0AAD9VJF0_9HYME|nr:hypothetical protein KPH14_005549 [Odynerus spinipes]